MAAITIFSKQRGMVSTFIDPTVPGLVGLKLQGWHDQAQVLAEG